jgi:hypothetical protein
MVQTSGKNFWKSQSWKLTSFLEQNFARLPVQSVLKNYCSA